MFRWNPDPEFFTIPFLNLPIMWYGVLFALGCALGFPIFKNILHRYFIAISWKNDEIDALVFKITDKMALYVLASAIIGARLGHFLFYENPWVYLHHPLTLFKIREGGLASHGGAIAIILSLFIFSRWSQRIEPGLTLIRLLDFIAVPTALAASFIRVGNFFNQEILGTPTILPWGVLFLSPADHSSIVPRHPVQLYEAFFYIVVFLLLWRMSFREKNLLCQGRLIGLFLICIFGFRFAIEFLKLEQSHLLLSPHFLTMGQWLSIPFILMGFYLYCKNRARGR
jgi:prolipoprotein diacylglyceryl transferase